MRRWIDLLFTVVFADIDKISDAFPVSSFTKFRLATVDERCLHKAPFIEPPRFSQFLIGENRGTDSQRRLKRRWNVKIFAKDASSTGAADDFVNSTKVLEGVARLVSQSITANAQSLAIQMDAPVWVQRGGPWAAEVFNKISRSDMAGAVSQMADWGGARAVNEETLLALWRLIPSEVTTMDKEYLKASETLRGDAESVAVKLADMAR